MVVDDLFAGVPVTDYEAALGFYERLLGRPADFFPHETEAVWKLRPASWIYVVADGERAGNALLTLMVDDLEEVVAELEARGLQVGAIEAVTTDTRKAEILDPDGNMITFAANRR